MKVNNYGIRIYEYKPNYLVATHQQLTPGHVFTQGAGQEWKSHTRNIGMMMVKQIVRDMLRKGLFLDHFALQAWS